MEIEKKCIEPRATFSVSGFSRLPVSAGLLCFKACSPTPWLPRCRSAVIGLWVSEARPLISWIHDTRVLESNTGSVRGRANQKLLGTVPVTDFVLLSLPLAGRWLFLPE